MMFIKKKTKAVTQRENIPGKNIYKGKNIPEPKKMKSSIYR